MPCHHNLKTYLSAYIEGAGFPTDFTIDNLFYRYFARLAQLERQVAQLTRQLHAGRTVGVASARIRRPADSLGHSTGFSLPNKPDRAYNIAINDGSTPGQDYISLTFHA